MVRQSRRPTLDTPLCPLCSAEPYRCEHAVLRWSHLAGEYEESGLEKLALAFEQTVRDRLLDAWESCAASGPGAQAGV